MREYVLWVKNLLRPVKCVKKQTADDSQHPYPRHPNRVKGLDIIVPDQVWVSDITYIRLHKEFVYLAIIMDVFTQVIRGWCLSRTVDQALTLMTLKASYPIATLCRILEVPRSSYYKVPKLKKSDQVILNAIEKIIVKWPYYGYRRITEELKRKGYEIGETRIRRLLRQIEHSCSVGKALNPSINGRHEHPRYPNVIKKMEINHLNQVWVADIIYIRFGRKFLYLAIILDAYSRGIRGWELGRNMDKHLMITALERA